MVLTKEELADLVLSTGYEDDFYVTIEKCEESAGKTCFLRIVTEEVPTNVGSQWLDR